MATLSWRPCLYYMTTNFKQLCSRKHIGFLNYYEEFMCQLRDRYEKAQVDVQEVEKSLGINLHTNKGSFSCNPKNTEIIFFGFYEDLLRCCERYPRISTVSIKGEAPVHDRSNRNKLWIFIHPGKEGMREIADQLNDVFLNETNILFINKLSSPELFASELWYILPVVRDIYEQNAQRWNDYVVAHTVKGDAISILSQFMVDELHQGSLSATRATLISEMIKLNLDFQPQGKVEKESFYKRENELKSAICRYILTCDAEIDFWCDQRPLEDLQNRKGEENSLEKIFCSTVEAIEQILLRILSAILSIVESFFDKDVTFDLEKLKANIKETIASYLRQTFADIESKSKGLFAYFSRLVFGTTSNQKVSKDEILQKTLCTLKANATAITEDICAIYNNFNLPPKRKAFVTAKRLNTELLFIQIEVDGLLQSLEEKSGHWRSPQKTLDPSTKKLLLKLDYVKAFGFLFDKFHVHVAEEHLQTPEDQQHVEKELTDILGECFQKEGFCVVRHSANAKITPLMYRPGTKLHRRPASSVKFGSLGAFAYGRGLDDMYALTCAHVLDEDGTLHVAQPNGGSICLGKCMAKVPLQDRTDNLNPEAKPIDFIDIAAVAVNKDVTRDCVECFCHDDKCDFRPTISNLNMCGQKVQKRGASDQDCVKKGVIIGRDYMIRELFGAFQNVLLISCQESGESFSVPGDSGSFVWADYPSSVQYDGKHAASAVAMVYGCHTAVGSSLVNLTEFAFPIFPDDNMTDQFPVTVAFGLNKALARLNESMPAGTHLSMCRPDNITDDNTQRLKMLGLFLALIVLFSFVRVMLSSLYDLDVKYARANSRLV